MMKTRLLIFLCIVFGTVTALSFSGTTSDLEDNVILGMVLLEDSTSTFEVAAVVKDLKQKWNLEVKGKVYKSPEPTVLEIKEYNIAIAFMPHAIPKEEIVATAEYNYFWEDGVTEAPKHQGHIIVSLLGGGKNPIYENVLFNKVVASVLNHSNSLGVYIGQRTLLLSKDFYLGNSEMLQGKELPILNWIYFGLRSDKKRNSVFTFGLSDFDKKEMEIVNSKRDKDQIFDMMYDITSYVLSYDVTLNDGETIGGSASQKIKISLSKGQFLEGKIFKIKILNLINGKSF